MTNLTVFNQDKASELFNSTNPFPICFDDAWQWLEYSKKDKAKDYLIANLEADIDFLLERELGSLAVPRPSEKISLSVEGFKNWAMMSKTEVGKQVRKYFIECERIAKQTSQPKQLTRVEEAKRYLKMCEELELAEAQIKLLEEDNERQAEVIDELFEYSSIIRIAKFNGCDEKAFSWHKLKAASKALDLEIKKAPCPRYVNKSLYAHDAWRLAYPGYRMPDTTTLVINQVA